MKLNEKLRTYLSKEEGKGWRHCQGREEEQEEDEGMHS
jgi:hypothetical protein